MSLRDIVLTAQDGNHDRLQVGLKLAELTYRAVGDGLIKPSGEITEKGKIFLARTETP